MTQTRFPRRCANCQITIRHGHYCTDCGGRPLTLDAARADPFKGLHDVNAGRDYRIEIFWDPEDKSYIAHAPDLKGCVVSGVTRTEAATIIDMVIRDVLEAHRAVGNPIPPPSKPTLPLRGARR